MGQTESAAARFEIARDQFRAAGSLLDEAAAADAMLALQGKIGRSGHGRRGTN
jgi:hypothetical protein